MAVRTIEVREKLMAKNDELAADWAIDAPRFEEQDPALFTRPSR